MALSSGKDSGVLFRRLFFFLLLISLTVLNLVLDFRGLSHPRGMELAQLARENSRGNYMETKMIRPIALKQAEIASEDENVTVTNFKDTYHAPLQPLLLGAIFKLIDAGDSDKWAIKNNQNVYALDQVVAGFSTICFLLSIVVIYVLVGKIFDPKIAGVTALLMLLCKLFWSFSASGLQHMLMLLLFSLALLYIYKALEKAAEGQVHLVPAVVAGVFLILLTLTHYMAVWILLAYCIYAAIAFRPRGAVGALLLVLTAATFAFFVFRNADYSGSFLGTAYITIYGGLGTSAEDVIMRSYNATEAPIDTTTLLRTVFSQFADHTAQTYAMMGAVLAIPFFFAALLHPFRRESISRFRWAILSLYLGALLGMSIYGLPVGELVHTNQFHIFFMAPMAAYGIAFLSILWARLDVVKKVPGLKNAHLFVIVALSAAPMAFPIVDQVKFAMFRGKEGTYRWPPYAPPILSKTLSNWIGDKEILVTDQPWATSWYCDKISIWLPRKVEELEQIDRKTTEQDTPIAGILISPSSTNETSLFEMSRNYQGFDSLVMDGLATQAVSPGQIFPGDQQRSFVNADPALSDIMRTFWHKTGLGGRGSMVFYSRSAVKRVVAGEE